MSAKSILSLISAIYGLMGCVVGQLSVDYYRFSCPSVDFIVFETMKELSSASNVVPPSTLRLFFHDCFIQGCDASIMISSTPFNTAERDLAENNIAQNAFDAIIQIKRAVDNVCPGVVSCADIIAMAARDAVRLLGGPGWQVPKGRLDSLVSQAAMAVGARQLFNSFAAMGLSMVDMVVLSDPTMDPNLVRALEMTCPLGGDPARFQPFDISTPFVFDNAYFRNLESGKGLLFSDQVLFGDGMTIFICYDKRS